ncbi:MAG: hypothetical protein ACRCWQ_02655 [Bacilli bacterium]
MPRRHGKVTIYTITQSNAPGTRFPVRELVPWKDFIYFEQDAYENSEGQGHQEVSDERIRIKVRYDADLRVGQVIKHKHGYYKIWRTWIDGRRYIELYANKFEWSVEDGED